LHAQFLRAARGLAEGEALAPAMEPQRRQALLAEEHFFSVFSSSRGQANTSHTYAGLQSAFAAAGLLDAAGAAVPPPLTGLDEIQAALSTSSEDAANAAQSQALAVGLVTLLLTILAGIAFQLYAHKLLGRSQRREDELM